MLPHDKKEMEKMTKHDLIDMVHKVKCGKLAKLNIEPLTKEEIIAHLLKSKCPMIKKFMKRK